MKVKIKRLEGYYTLVVADQAINEKYEASNERPIVLGKMENFFSSGCWSLSDYRLGKYLHPSPYFEEGIEIMEYSSEKEKNDIISQLHTYKINEEKNLISWSKFDGYVFDGDNPSCQDKYGNSYSSVARFTYKEAYKRLKEQKEFWEKYQGDDLTLEELKLPNPHRQPHSLTLNLRNKGKNT